jgi:hypothetical protein
VKLADYAALGGHISEVRPLSSIVGDGDGRQRVQVRVESGKNGK